jgi:hypothetical protein
MLHVVQTVASTFWVGVSRAGTNDWRWNGDAGVAALPIPWGDGQPKPGNNDFAYVSLLAGSVDHTLLRNEGDAGTGDDADQRPFLCEVPEKAPESM